MCWCTVDDRWFFLIIFTPAFSSGCFSTFSYRQRLNSHHCKSNAPKANHLIIIIPLYSFFSWELLSPASDVVIYNIGSGDIVIDHVDLALHTSSTGNYNSIASNIIEGSEFLILWYKNVCSGTDGLLGNNDPICSTTLYVERAGRLALTYTVHCYICFYP